MKNVLWRVAKCLSYIEDARCLKVKQISNFQYFSFLIYLCRLPGVAEMPELFLEVL